MGTSHRRVAELWALGVKSTGMNMFSDGTTVYSWGIHFPIATKLKDGSVLFNWDKYSSSTRKHQGHVWHVISDRSKIYECNTQEIERALDNPGAPIVIVKQKEYNTIEGCVSNIRKICKREGMKRFPFKKSVDYFKMKLFIEKI